MELATQAIKCSWALSGPLTHVEAFMHTPNPVPTQARTAMPVHHLSHIRLLPKLFPKTMGQAGLLYGRLHLMLWCLGRAFAFPETASMLHLTRAVDH